MPVVVPGGTIGAMNRTEIDDIARDMWSTRPVRRRDDRKIAGVAAAIGHRYGVDPILVRVAFVVVTVFGGVGVLLYLLGWLLLPQEGDQASGAEALVGHGQSSMSKPLAIVLMVALIPASSAIFTEQLAGLLALALVAGGFFLLHRHRSGYGLGHQAATPTGVGGGGAGPDLAADHHQPPGQPYPQPGPATPPAWDPLGVAPFAWDLPEPAPVPPPPPVERRHRSAVTPVTLALALMTAGATAIVATTTDAVGAREIAAFALAVVGLGLVAGSFVRGGRGLIAVAVPLGLLTYALAVVPVNHFGAHGVGDRTWSARSVDQLQPVYQLSAGNARLDLRDLRLADSEQVHTSVQLGAGELNVLLPPDADVQVHCEAGVGEIDCLGPVTNGVTPDTDHTDPGRDGPGKGGTIVLDISLGAGHAVVTRG